MRRRTLGLVTGLVAGLALAASPAGAASLTIDLDFEFSGADAPVGASPWLTATFDDSFGGADTVRLTMSAANLTDQEFAAEWLFNFDPSLDATLLAFTIVDNSASVPVITTGTNAFMADGDGFFDIKFAFPPPPGPFPGKFTTGETVIYDLTYVAAITAASFDFQSVLGGGAGTYTSAAQVQGIGIDDEGSGWIGDGGSVPEPSLLALFGLAGLAALRLRRA